MINRDDNVHVGLEKIAGARRMQRLYSKVNKLTDRGLPIPEGLKSATRSAGAKMQRRADRNPVYKAEMQRRFGQTYGSRANEDRVISEIATGFNKKRFGEGSSILYGKKGGKMVDPSITNRKQKFRFKSER